MVGLPVWSAPILVIFGLLYLREAFRVTEDRPFFYIWRPKALIWGVGLLALGVDTILLAVRPL